MEPALNNESLKYCTDTTIITVVKPIFGVIKPLYGLLKAIMPGCPVLNSLLMAVASGPLNVILEQNDEISRMHEIPNDSQVSIGNMARYQSLLRRELPLTCGLNFHHEGYIQ